MLNSFVGWAKLKLLVEQATSADDEPTPIYVLDEVAAALAAGDARAGVDAVVARLGHRSPAVKHKALRLVAHLGRKGTPEVRRLLSRQGAPLRDLLHFRCDPDPFTGDAVWRRVQQAAQEALAAVHGEAAAAEPAHSSLGGRIQGFGSDAASGGAHGFGSEGAGGGGGGGGGRMVGFGSADVLQSGVQAVSSGMRSLSSKAGGLLRQDGYSSSQLDGGAGYGGYGGDAAQPAPAPSQGIVQPGGPLLAPPSAAGAAPSTGGGSQAGGGGGGGSAEQRAVDRVCTPAGLRAAPAREDLAAFVAAVSPLDGPAVARLLEGKLEAGPWQCTLRALCAIEAVLDGGASQACGQVAAHFAARPDAVRRAADSPQASVRQRAAKLLAALGAGGAAAAAQPVPQQPQQQLFTEDLLGEVEAPAAQPAAAATGTDLADLLGEPAAGAATAAPPGGGAQLAAAPADLLAGLDISAPGGSPAPGPMTALGLSGPPPPAADPFGGMLLGDVQPRAAAAAPQPPAAAAAPDLLGGFAPQGPTAAAPAVPAVQAGGALDDVLGGLFGGGAAVQGQQQQPFSGMALPDWPSAAVPGTQPGWQQPAAPQLAAIQGAPFGGAASGGLHPPHGGSGPFHHGRQPSQNGGSMSRLSSSGIIDSTKDSSFNFVGDAIAAARRKK